MPHRTPAPVVVEAPKRRAHARAARTAAPALALLALAGCSRSDNSAPAPTQPAVTPAAAPAPAQPTAAPTPAAPTAPAPTAPAPTAPGATASNYGAVTLAAGFVPDPHTQSVVSGGPIDGSTMGTGCNGHVSSTPDFILNLTSQESFLRIYVTSQSDTTLVIRKPDGTMLCNDDSTYGIDPVVEGAFAPGSYRIWVGSFSASEQAHAVLNVTELQSNHP